MNYRLIKIHILKDGNKERNGWEYLELIGYL